MFPFIAGALIAHITSTKKNDNPESPALAGARHEGIAKTALTDCGRLKPGYKFLKGGKIIKVEDEAKPDHKELKAKILDLKTKFGLSGYQPEITVCGLSGALLADGHTIITDDELALFSDKELLAALGASAKDVEAIVNELILDKINTGDKLPPWKKTWANKTNIAAQNFVTKKEYTGSNSIILNIILGSIMPTPYYITANQIKTLGGRIKKGSKTIPLVYYNFINSLKDFSNDPEKEAVLLKKINGYEVKRKGKKTKKLSKSNYANTVLTEKEIAHLDLDRNEYISKGFLKYYRVFNIADTEGIEYNLPDYKPKSKNERIEAAEEIVSSFKDKPGIYEDPKEAFYEPKTDKLYIPNINQFDNTEEYYSTLFHELIHSTLHETRLDREKQYKGKEKNAIYAFEELIAELGGSYLCGLAGILEATHLNQASYLKGWYKKLQKLAGEHTNFFIFATREAQKAVDYIIKDYVPGSKPKKEEKEKNNQDIVKAKARAKALKLKLKLKVK